MKKISKIFLILIVVLSFSFIFVKAEEPEYKSYTADEYFQKLNESVAYAMSLIDDNMTDHEKAFVLAQYVQEGNLYRLNSPNNQSAEGVLVDHAAVCAGFNDAYRLLLNTAGIPCELIRSTKANHQWTVCYLDGEWTYADTTKSVAAYSEANSRLFLSQEDFDLEVMGESYFFQDAYDFSNGFSLPSETKSNLEVRHTSQVYYDSTYKYYLDGIRSGIKTVGKIFKENRKTGETTLIVDGAQYSYAGDNSNIVKNGDTIYYVGDDNRTIYSISTDGTNKKQIEKLSTGYALGVFSQDGIIYYTYLPKENSINEFEKKQIGTLTNYITTKEYTVNNSNQKYILKYTKTSKGVTIIKCTGIGSAKPTGTISIPSTIDGSPVIGIGNRAFYSVDLTGNLVLPTNLEYIGDEAFAYSDITGITFNNKLKTVGMKAFNSCDKITGKISIPNSVSYINIYAFSGCSNVTDLSLSNKLKYISRNAFYQCNLPEVLEIPEGIERIGSSAFGRNNNLKAVILPSTLKELNNAFALCNNLEDIWIKSSKMEYMYKITDKNVYLPKNTTTSTLADKSGIVYKDSTNLSFSNNAEFKISNLRTGEENISSINLELGDNKTQLKCDISPKFWLPYNVSWNSTSQGIVSINQDGVVDAKGVDNCQITVTCNGKTKSINCVVQNLNTIKFDNSALSIKKDESANLNIVSGINSNSQITWKIASYSNEDVEYDITDSKITQYVKVETTSNKNQIKITAVDAENDNYKYKLIAYDSTTNQKGICEISVIVLPTQIFFFKVNKPDIKIVNYAVSTCTTVIDYQNEDTRDLILSLTYIPTNATPQSELIWTVEDESIIRNNGKGSFTILRGGKTKIFVELEGCDKRDLEVTITGDVPIDSVSLNKTSLKLKKGTTEQLSLDINPKNTTRDKTISWSSSNTAIADVDSNGKITAKGNGITNITARCGDFIATCVVEVREAFFVDKIITIDKAYIIDLDDEVSKAELDNGQEVEVTWTTNNSNIIDLTNKNRRYWGSSSGFATLTASDERYGTVTYIVYVSEPSIPMENGRNRYPCDLNGNLKFDEEDLKALIQKIDNEDVGNLSNSELIDYDINGDRILNDVDKKLFEEIIKNNSITLKEVPIISVSLDNQGTFGSLFGGIDSITIFPKFYPDTTTDEKTLTWESSNNKVATVENGVIKPLSAGTVTITAKTPKGITSSKDFTFTEEDIPKKPAPKKEITGVNLDKTSLSLTKGDTAKLTATITPSDTTEDRTLTWKSDNQNVVSVDNSGNLNAVGVGNAIITVTTSNGKTANCNVEVKDKEVVNPDPQKPEPQEPDPEKPDPEKPDPQDPNPQNPDPVKPDIPVNPDSTVTSDTKGVIYRTQVQDDGWQGLKQNGETAGTSGRSLRLESIEIYLQNMEVPGGITYRTHVQDIGWQDWKSNGEMAGTVYMSLRLEAIEIKLTGELESRYDIYYRVHAQEFGWLDWAKNGESSGTSGYGYRLEAIEIKLVPKGEPAPGPTTNIYRMPVPEIEYTTHVQEIGWQPNVKNGEMAGTSGLSYRLEAIRISSIYTDLGLVYQTHIQDIGWQGWKSNGDISGTSGMSLRLEAIQINLTGTLSRYFDIYYRVHSQEFGWLDWAKNGESAGTQGYGYRLEAIEIVLVNKGDSAPGLTDRPFVSSY